MKHLPNILSLSRILLAVIFVWCVSQNNLFFIILASLIFIAASLTDYYDGYFAKKYSTKSNVGIILDPVADKVLILSAFFIFVQLRLMEPWMFIIIFVREVVITLLRFAAICRGKFLAAERAGKVKTVAQMVAIFLILLTMILRSSGTLSLWPAPMVHTWAVLVVFVLWTVVVLTVFSGVSYLWNNRKAIHAA